MTQEEITGRCPMAKIDTIADKIVVYIRRHLEKKYPGKKPLRVFHTKTIGLVKGLLKVKDGLPADLKKGLFQKEETYKIWIRFTNGNPSVTDDKTKAARGMAIKIMSVTSSRFLDDDPEGNTQDIILFTSRTFAPGVADYQPDGVKLVIPRGLNFIKSAITIIRHAFKGSLPFLRSVRIQVPNVLEENYYSGTPYSFGADRAIKWHASPLKTITSLMPEKPRKDFLKERLTDDLSTGAKEEVAFGLYVQFQENEHTEPVDNSSVLWETPFHQVGTILLPKQNLASDEMDQRITFSPGHSMVEHAPLGGVNMVRRKAYAILSAERLAHS